MAPGILRLATLLAVVLTGCSEPAPTVTASPAATSSPVAAARSPEATPAPSLDSPITTDPAEMDERYQAALARFAYDETQALDITREPTSTRAGLPRDDLEYTSPMGGRVPAYLIRPVADGTYPGLIVMHGSGGSRGDLLDIGYEYAALDVVVLLISAPPARTEPPGPFITLTPADADDQVQLIVDLRRAVDVLIEVGADPERIGYLGVSYGAAMGALLAGVEPRIRAYLLDVGDGGLVTHLTGPEDVGGELSRLSPEARQAWLDAMEPIEPIYFIGHADRSALLFQNGRLDELVPATDAERLHAVASEPKTIQWYDSGHFLPDEAWCDGAEWLREHLGFDEGPLRPACG